MQVDELDFDSLEVIELPVKYKGQKYTLRSADCEAVVKYKNKQISCAKVSEGAISGISGFADLEPYLVSLCLYRVLPTSSSPGETVPEAVVRTFPYSMVKRLNDKAKLISELEEAEETIAGLEAKLATLKKIEESRKNGQKSTETGSS